MRTTSQNANHNKVAIILTQGFADWEYSFIAGLGKSYYGLDIQFFTPRIGELSSQGGLMVNVSKSINEITNFSPKAMVIIGGTIWGTDNAPDLNQLLRDYHASGGFIAGICGGTLALARSGLLNHVEHTSNNIDFLINNAASYSGNRYYQNTSKAVSDKQIITAAGTAPISFSMAVFESVGVDKDSVAQLGSMMAAEYQ